MTMVLPRVLTSALARPGVTPRRQAVLEQRGLLGTRQLDGGPDVGQGHHTQLREQQHDGHDRVEHHMGGVGRPARHHVGCGAVLLAPPSLSLSDCVHSCGFPTLGFRIVRAWGPVDCSRMVLRAYSQRHHDPWCMQ